MYPLPVLIPPDDRTQKHPGSGLGSRVSRASEGKCVGQEAEIVGCELV